MKLVHLTKYFWPDNGGGVASAIDMFINAIKENEKDKNPEQEIICCWQEKRKKYKKDTYKGVIVLRCESLFEFASTQFSPQLLNVISKETKDSDYVIYNFPYPLIDIAILLKRVKSRKLIVWWHCDYETLKGKVLARLYEPFVRNTLKKADAIIVSAQKNIECSEALAQYKEKCHVIPFAVSESVEKRGSDYYNSLRSNPIHKERVNVLFIGRFVWYKGIDILLRAFQMLEQNKYQLTLIGEGPLFDDMKELAESLNIKNAYFAGSVYGDKKYEWIEWCDYLVLPSISKAESFAIVQIEAMSFGKPVINTNLPSGVIEVCPNGLAGITVEPKDVQGLSVAMERLGTDLVLREQLGGHAIELINNKYNVRSLSSNYEMLLRTI